MQPFRIDQDQIPCFTSQQVDDYGFPEHWGYEVYRIIENRDCQNYVTDFKLEQSYYKRPIHRYNRRQRFETTLQQLLGEKGKVPDHIITVIQHHLNPNKNLWDQVRAMLKHYKLRIYYNRIPYIIQKCTQKQPVQWSKSNDQYRAMMEDFDKICFIFDQQKHQFQRKYFPNMRFIALKLMELHGITLTYPIPLTRTLRKRKDLEMIWNIFIYSGY